ncbi:unnamed protein product [Rotaria socialis]|uniref:Uncharacterized protein n=1 Tax=Rotaria socialis TaxID=392032 RepID=A0A821ICL3_9BILA|nr:unnamed protein product [Rotaria socialis]
MAEEQEKVDFKTTDDTDSIGNSLKQSSIQYVSMNNKNFQVKNQRPGTDLELRSRQAFEEICRQQHAQLSKIRQATLFCRYRHNNHPYLIFRPVKEEKVLDEPAVFLFYDVVSDSDIEKNQSSSCTSGKKKNDIRHKCMEPSGPNYYNSGIIGNNSYFTVTTCSRTQRCNQHDYIC